MGEFPDLVSAEERTDSSVNASYSTILLFHSYQTSHTSARGDPLLPATSKVKFPLYYENIYGWDAYQNDNPLPGILGCTDNASIRSPVTGKEWNFDYGSSAPVPPSAPRVQWPTNHFKEHFTPYMFNRSFYDSAAFNMTGSIPSLSSSSWDSKTRGRASITEEDVVVTLLSRALWRSTMCSSFGQKRAVDVVDSVWRCRENRICYYLPLDQWKIEARNLFQISLAQIQYNVLEVAQGTDMKLPHPGYQNTPNYPYWEWLGSLPDTPPGFEDVCKMVKFKSTGWRNVSTWGFLGVLIFAAGVSLGSCRTEEKQELFLVVACRAVYRLLGRLGRNLCSLLWTEGKLTFFILKCQIRRRPLGRGCGEV